MSPTRSRAREEAVGGLLVGAAGLQFGTVVVLASSIVDRRIPVTSILAVRFGVAAVILAGVLVALRRPLLAASGERGGVTLLALFGYAVEASFFFAALEHGTAAAATLIFYTYPVFVALGSWAVLRRGAPARPTLLALGLAISGVAIVVGVGGSLVIEPLGVAFALASALLISGYMLGADVVLQRTQPLTSAMWVSGGASVGLFVSSLLAGRWQAPIGWPEWGPILGMGLATAGAFVCLLAGIQRLGAERTAIVSSSEPLAAAFLAWMFLGQAIGVGVAIGGVLILAGAVVASLSRHPTPQEQQIP